MGPDEYHDAYPGAEEPGLDNNAYTNVMTVWVMRRALELLERLAPYQRAEIEADHHLDLAELDRWRDMTSRMHVALPRDARRSARHQPVPGLRGSGGVRLGDVPRALRRHLAPRPRPEVDPLGSTSAHRPGSRPHCRKSSRAMASAGTSTSAHRPGSRPHVRPRPRLDF
ncbi:MAG: hypothetical protein ACRDUY_07185 [Nitriliruptorales bacterium]